MLPAHPDTIPDLAPDCRRVLREEYQRVQVAADAGPLDSVATYDVATGTIPVLVVVPRAHREAMARGEYRGPSWAKYGKAAAVSKGGKRTREEWPDPLTEADYKAARAAIESRRVTLAIAEYKRVAQLWGVEV